MHLIIKAVIYTVATFICSAILPGIKFENTTSIIIVGLVLIVLNFTVKPLLKIISFPITLVTLGLFRLIINAIIMVIVDLLVPQFAIDNFLWAVIFGLVFSIIAGVLESIAGMTVDRD